MNESHSLRAWADRFNYFPDASLHLSPSSWASSHRLWLHLAGLGIGPSFDLGEFRLRYRNVALVSAPDSEILLSPTNATLYFDRTQSFAGSGSRCLGYLTSVYGSYQWVERRNNARDFSLRYTLVNAGVSTQFLPNLAAFVDFLWEDWGSNVSGTDPLNTGEDGRLGEGAAVRPWFSDGQAWTIGLNSDLSEQSSLDGTFTHYGGRGGERSRATYVGLEFR